MPLPDAEKRVHCRSSQVFIKKVGYFIEFRRLRLGKCTHFSVLQWLARMLLMKLENGRVHHDAIG